MSIVKKKYQREYYTQNPKGVYIRQRANARRRGIPWEFTFNTWWGVWKNSGKWEHRGMGKGKYCMARRGDLGPYSPENVRIITFSQNSKIAIKRNEIWKCKLNVTPLDKRYY